MAIARQTLFASCLLAAATAGRAAVAEQAARRVADDGSRQPIGDMFCGPRCVQYILDYYGRHEDLLPLIEEIQERNWSEGSSLRSVEMALNRRGIQTAAITVGRFAQVSWPRPVIIHLAGTGNSLGHFVVDVTETPSSMARVWCGLTGVHSLSQAQLGKLRSGVILLTSEDRIVAPREAVRGIWRAPLVIALTFVITALGWRLPWHRILFPRKGVY